MQKIILLFHDCFMFCCETRLVPMVCYRLGSYSAGHVQITVLLEMEGSIKLSLNCQDLDVDKSKQTSNWLNCHQEKLKKSWGRSRKSTEVWKNSKHVPSCLSHCNPGWALSFVGEMKTEQSVQDATEQVSRVVSSQPSSASFGPRSDHDQYSTQRLTDTWNKEWQQKILLFRTKSFPDMKRKPGSFYW